MKVSKEFSGRFWASLKSGDVLISSPHPVIPRRVALQHSPLLFHGTGPLWQPSLGLSSPFWAVFPPPERAWPGRPDAYSGAAGGRPPVCGPVRRRFPARGPASLSAGVTEPMALCKRRVL